MMRINRWILLLLLGVCSMGLIYTTTSSQQIMNTIVSSYGRFHNSKIWHAVNTLTSGDAISQVASGNSTSTSTMEEWDGPVYLLVVMCGGRWRDGVEAVRSAAYFTQQALHVDAFTEKGQMTNVRRQLESVTKSFQHVTIGVHEAVFPTEQWHKLFRPCSSLRLFAHEILPAARNWTIYVDADTLVLSTLAELWKLRAEMRARRSPTAIGVTWKDVGPNTYHKLADLPYLQPWGVNPGVLLLDLERLRAAGWTQLLQKYYKQYKHLLRFGDQCLLNVILHFHPELAYIVPVSWNFETDFCDSCSRLTSSPPDAAAAAALVKSPTSAELCQQLVHSGAKLVHGTRSVFTKPKKDLPAMRFHNIYASVVKALNAAETVNRSSFTWSWLCTDGS